MALRGLVDRAVLGLIPLFCVSRTGHGTGDFHVGSDGLAEPLLGRGGGGGGACLLPCPILPEVPTPLPKFTHVIWRRVSPTLPSSSFGKTRKVTRALRLSPTSSAPFSLSAVELHHDIIRLWLAYLVMLLDHNYRMPHIWPCLQE